MDRDAAARFLNLYNIHHDGHMHGVFPVHVGMRVRMTQRINATLGLVREQKTTILDIGMHLPMMLVINWLNRGQSSGHDICLQAFGCKSMILFLAQCGNHYCLWWPVFLMKSLLI